MEFGGALDVEFSGAVVEFTGGDVEFGGASMWSSVAPLSFRCRRGLSATFPAQVRALAGTLDACRDRRIFCFVGYAEDLVEELHVAGLHVVCTPARDAEP